MVRHPDGPPGGHRRQVRRLRRRRSGTVRGGLPGVQQAGARCGRHLRSAGAAAADGIGTDAGPASGFGLWVRVLHDDGSTTICGHINEALVERGQNVRADRQIATVGNRGDPTGPHLHFKVRNAAGVAVDPARWLAERGAFVAPIGGPGSLF
ncbi:peptidoglycan DD-metalloendopeptidase family protein [Tomitella cavernea]